jgi:hypothetical protein
LKKAGFAALVAMMSGMAPPGASAQPLPSDHVIVPGVRIGNAELEPADQGALVRELGEPNQTEQHGDKAIYRYGAPQPDGTVPDELVVTFDLAADAPFEIATASAAYRTPDGLGVDSAATAIREKLGPPVCESGDAKSGGGLIVYPSIWFLTVHGIVTRVSIRGHLRRGDFSTGSIQC